MNGLETLPPVTGEQLPPPTAPEQLPQAAPELTPLPPSTPEREAKLDFLLGPDREFAEQSGLVGMFDYDPATHQDGLVHVLAGDEGKYPGGVEIPGGFHHEPSAELWNVGRKPESEQPAADSAQS